MKRTYYQGIWDFPDFQSYLSEWIIPYMLRDLETVFQGARDRWEQLDRPDAGRGDFVLSTALFAIFDHLGSFMGHFSDSLSTRENISRCARKLESTRDVDLILGQFGRNALVHRAWPQTIAVMDNWSWAFGLNVTGNPDESDHLRLYWRQYELPSENGSVREIRVLKLRMNVGILRRELEQLITEEGFAISIQPDVFRRVREIAIRSANDPFGHPDQLLGGAGLGRNWRDAVERQIRAQYNRAPAV